MPWNLDSSRPIYLQIIERVQMDIITGRYQPGDKLPSVRDLAQEAAVNPNTMQKALSELERSGLIYSQRTSGRFITEDKELIHQMKKELAAAEVSAFVAHMKQLGITPEEIRQLLAETIELVTCKDLTKRFGNHTALDHLNLSLDSGKIIGLLGPNGSGKTTLLKLLNGLLTPSEGEVLIAGNHPGIETKRVVSYLPDKMYLGSWMRVSDLLTYYSDFFEDFDMSRANAMLESLKISPKDRLKTMSKGTKEKVQLILTMSRRAKLYCLDEPIAGVDPAARDYILSTILNNYEPDASILISTHLISDVENILDEVIFIQEGQLKLHASVEDIRMQEGESIDSYFREVFKC